MVFDQMGLMASRQNVVKHVMTMRTTGRPSPLSHLLAFGQSGQESVKVSAQGYALVVTTTGQPSWFENVNPLVTSSMSRTQVSHDVRHKAAWIPLLRSCASRRVEGLQTRSSTHQPNAPAEGLNTYGVVWTGLNLINTAEER